MRRLTLELEKILLAQKVKYFQMHMLNFSECEIMDHFLQTHSRSPLYNDFIGMKISYFKSHSFHQLLILHIKNNLSIGHILDGNM